MASNRISSLSVALRGRPRNRFAPPAAPDLSPAGDVAPEDDLATQLMGLDSLGERDALLREQFGGIPSRGQRRAMAESNPIGSLIGQIRDSGQRRSLGTELDANLQDRQSRRSHLLSQLLRGQPQPEGTEPQQDPNLPGGYVGSAFSPTMPMPMSKSLRGELPEEQLQLLAASNDPVLSKFAALKLDAAKEAARLQRDRDIHPPKAAPATKPVDPLIEEGRRLKNALAQKRLNAPPKAAKPADADSRTKIARERFERQKATAEVPGFVDLNPDNPHPISQENADELRKAATAHDYVLAQLEQLAPILAQRPLPKSKEMADAQAIIAEMQGPVASMNDFNLTQGHQELQHAMLGDPEALSQLVNEGRLQAQIDRLRHSAELALDTRAKGMQRKRGGGAPKKVAGDTSLETPPITSRAMSPDEKRLFDWAIANPDNPKASAVMERLLGKK